MDSRREFIDDSLAVAASAGSFVHAGAATPHDDEASAKGKEGMIVHSLHFLNLEMPPEYANSWLTPVSHFFVRNHLFEPSAINTAEWKLSVSGEVDRPLTITLAELHELEQHSVINTLECAGNGRAFHNPKIPEIQWRHGAIGTALFSGPRLADVLQRAGIRPRGKHVMFRGLDEASGSVPPFIRSIPVEKAIDPDTLIATHMKSG